LALLGVEGVLAFKEELLEVKIADLLRHALQLQAQLIEHDLKREHRILNLHSVCVSMERAYAQGLVWRYESHEQLRP
jgi:hypothetical protein